MYLYNIIGIICVDIVWSWWWCSHLKQTRAECKHLCATIRQIHISWHIHFRPCFRFRIEFHSSLFLYTLSSHLFISILAPSLSVSFIPMIWWAQLSLCSQVSGACDDFDCIWLQHFPPFICRRSCFCYLPDGLFSALMLAFMNILLNWTCLKGVWDTNRHRNV